MIVEIISKKKKNLATYFTQANFVNKVHKK